MRTLDDERQHAAILMELGERKMMEGRRLHRMGYVINRDSRLSRDEWDARWAVWEEHMDQHHADGSACDHGRTHAER